MFWIGLLLFLSVSAMIVWAIVAPKSVLHSFGWKDEVDIGTITVKKLTAGTLTKTITIKGRVQAYQEITVTSQVSGEIKRIYCKEGEAVKKDQLLVEIDPKTLVEELATTKSRLEQARLSLATLKIRNQESREKLERAERLFRQKLHSIEEIQALRYAVAVNDTEMERAAWQIKEMEYEVASIDKKLGQTKISSPMDGVVTRLILKEGEGVIQGLVNTSGTAIMRISDMTQTGVTVWISEADVPFLRPGQSVDITSPNFRGRVFKAHLAQIAMTGNAEQQTDLTKFEVKTMFDTPYPELRLEMSAVVSIEVGNKCDVLKLPLSAVQTEERKEEDVAKEKKRRHRRPQDDISNIFYQDFVFAVENDKLVKRHITTGLSNDKEVEVADGLSTGMLVVIGPAKSFAKLENGKPVKWEEEKFEEAGNNADASDDATDNKKQAGA